MCAYLFYKTLNLSSRHTQKSNNNKKESGIKNTHGKKKSFLKEEPVLRDLFYWHVYDWFYGAMHQKDVPSFFPFPLEIYKFKILSAKCFCSFVKVGTESLCAKHCKTCKSFLCIKKENTTEKQVILIITQHVREDSVYPLITEKLRESGVVGGS